MAALPINGVGAVSPGVGRGLLRVVSNSQLQAQEQAALDSVQKQSEDQQASMLASHIRARMTEMRNFRNTEGIGERLIDALRTYKGKYDQAKLQEITKFGGSQVYARITATKCRGATALLRDVFLGPDRPWDITPTPEPILPDDIDQNINQLVSIEVATLSQAGVPVDPTQVSDRIRQLRDTAKQAAKKQADKEAAKSASQLDDVLQEGLFYEAFAEFLIDLPIFPFACLKGPVVRRVNQLKWVEGAVQIQPTPRMFWQRVSPFDLYFSPGASGPHEAEFVERIRLTRAELLAVRGLPGYNDQAINEVLTRFSDSGFREWWDVTDAERAHLEDRERWPRATGSNLIDTAEFHGSVQGSTLLDWGMNPAEISDSLQEYQVTAWLIDRFVIKVQINPNPRQRHPYYITSFEKVPGAMIGYGLPDLLDDIQQVSNATVRSLVNNLSISSGPQVVINDEVLTTGETDDMYPWKRWHVKFDPMLTGTSKPIDFFQPMSNANELLGIYEKFSQMADDVSAIPRYMTGNEKVGGAGRTASGLAMLMGNAAKTLQNVAATIDRDIMDPLLTDLYDMIMLTMPGVFRGDEQIVVKGVNFAVKREQDRMRQLEFLQLTGNPIDMQIVGPIGRANVLRSVAGNLGLDHERVVPTDEEINAMVNPPQQQQQGMPGAPGALPAPNQMEGPEAQRAGPEAARKSTGVEGQFAGNGRAGGGTPSGG